MRTKILWLLVDFDAGARFASIAFLARDYLAYTVAFVHMSWIWTSRESYLLYCVAQVEFWEVDRLGFCSVAHTFFFFGSMYIMSLFVCDSQASCLQCWDRLGTLYNYAPVFNVCIIWNSLVRHRKKFDSRCHCATCNTIFTPCGCLIGDLCSQRSCSTGSFI